MGKGQSRDVQKISVKRRRIDNLLLFVQDQYFVYATQLETIKASHNSIPSIPVEFCKEFAKNASLVSSLSYIDLSHNVLKTLPVEFFACGT
jgi:hypothetical protein